MIEPTSAPSSTHLTVILVTRLDDDMHRLLRYARTLPPVTITAAHVVTDPISAQEIAAGWMDGFAPAIPLHLLDNTQGIASTIAHHVRGLLDGHWHYVTILVGVKPGRPRLSKQISRAVHPLPSVCVARAVL